MSITAGELASKLNLELRGDADYPLEGVCSLANGRANHLTFLGDKRYAKHLATTEAGAIIIRESEADQCSAVCMLAENPQLAFARAAALFDPERPPESGVHPSASVEESATIDSSASIGPQVSIGRNVQIGADVVIGPGCVVGDDVVIGAGSRLIANVTVIGRAQLGERVTILPSAIIGARGFGLVQDENKNFLPVPQLGRVVIGDDVEIGASTTVDRGAIDDTIIEKGCKIDNQIHIGHNCRIGQNTVIAGWSAVAGSTHIGKGCLIAGGVGIADNLSICDGVMVTGMTMVSGDITEPGVYSSGWGAIPRKDWVKILHASRSLDNLDPRLTRLEESVGLAESTSDQGSEND